MSIKQTIEWHNANEELPKDSGWYMCASGNGRLDFLPFSEMHGKFNCWDNATEEELKYFSTDVDWWAEVPTPTDTTNSETPNN